MAEFVYNTEFNRYKILSICDELWTESAMGHEPRSRTKVESVEKFLDGMKRTREDAKSALKRAGDEMKKY